MPKFSINFSKVLLLSMVGVAFLTLAASNKINAADGVFACSTISLNRNNQQWTPDKRIIKLKADGSYDQYNVLVDITVQLPPGVDNSSYNVANGYEFVYTIPGGGQQEVVVDLSSRSATLNMPITREGNWEYTLRTVDNALTVNGSSDLGCPQNNTSFQFSVALDAANSDNVLFAGSCSSQIPIGKANNHFTCEATGAPSGAKHRVLPSDSFCPGGSIPDAAANLCANSTSPSGGSLDSQSSFCFPCAAQAKTVVKHLEGCDLDGSVRICEAGNTCRPTGGLGDTEAGRCIRELRDLNLNASCHLAYKEGECDNDPLYTVCVRSDSEPEASRPYIGRCEQLQGECPGPGVGDDKCVRDCVDGGGTDTYCSQAKCEVGTAGESICVVPPPDDGNNGNGGIPSSNQFGKCRCSNVTCTDAAGKPTLDSSAAVSAVPSVDTEPARSDALACMACADAGNTWTDSLGCVTTTPNGVFTTILRIGIGVIGGVSLFRLIILGFQMNFGVKEADIKKSQEDILGILGGILLAVFGILLLRIIGVNILDVVPTGFFGS